MSSRSILGARSDGMSVLFDIARTNAKLPVVIDDPRIACDRLFFARRPGRNHRIRRAFPCEAAAVVASAGGALPTLSGVALFAFVRRFSFGGIVRAYAYAPSTVETDLDDTEVKALLDKLTALNGGAWNGPTSWEGWPQ